MNLQNTNQNITQNNLKKNLQNTLQDILGKNYKWLYISYFHFKGQLYYTKGTLAYLLATLIQLSVALITFYVLGKENKNDFISYIWFANFYSILAPLWLQEELCEKIRRGGLSKFLMYPTSVFWYNIFDFIGRGVLASSWILLIPNIVLLPFLYNNFNFNLSFVNIFSLVLMYPAMYLIKFCGQWLVSMLTFWIVDTGGSNMSYDLLITFLGGFNLPLFLLPVWVSWTPFAFIGHYPATIFLGKENNPLSLVLISYTVALGMYLLSQYIYKLGLKKYEAIGL